MFPALQVMQIVIIPEQGNQVTVYGTADITVTAGSTITVFAVSLPVASNFTATADCTGTAAGNTNPVPWELLQAVWLTTGRR
jgi:hypothetical protein